MRVISGEFGGRRLVTPEGDTTRPTTDKVRQAVFNSLASMGVLEGAVVADLFAGSGALGIEAVSRGAEKCVFVERDRAALIALRENIATLGIEDRCTVHGTDVLAWVPAMRNVDVAFIDPMRSRPGRRCSNWSMSVWSWPRPTTRSARPKVGRNCALAATAARG